MQNTLKTVSQFLKYIISNFSLNDNIKNPEMEARWLLSHFLSFEQIDFVSKQDYVLNAKERRMIFSGVKQRLKNVPLAYIIGKTSFYGYDIMVNRGVLIPRIDSEILITNVIECLSCDDNLKNEKINIIDLCSGSGCLGLVVGKELLKKKVKSNLLFVDISKKALSVSKKNANNLGLCDASSFVKFDVFSKNFDKKLKSVMNKNEYGESPWVVVSNPPYLSLEDMYDISNEMKCEPRIALESVPDGLSHYRQILKSINSIVNICKSDSFQKNKQVIIKTLFFEIGFNQESDIKKICKQYNFEDVIFYKDIEKRTRVVQINV